MKLTIIIQDDGKGTAETTAEINIGKGAENLPATQLQDALADLNTQLLDAIINYGNANNMATAEQMFTITIGNVSPIAVAIKTTEAPNNSNAQ